MNRRFGFISAHRGVHGVKRMCSVLGVSRSGFYRWQAAGPARQARAGAEDALAARIRAAHDASGDAYGSPRITTDLRESGMAVNHKRVERVMRQRGVIGIHQRRRVRTTVPDPAAAPVPDLIGRDFTATAPDQRWCGDITYLPLTGGRWLYLATVIDIYSRRLIGWSMATHLRTTLVTDALDAAVAARGGPGQIAGVVFHSDRGTQYTSSEYARHCDRNRIRRSMGRIGTSYDNALAEAFFATLKRELRLDQHTWTTDADARHDTFRWIAFYNHRRRHSALGHTSPADYEHTLKTTPATPIAA